MEERSLSTLYQSVILQHDRQPFHYYKMEMPDVMLEAYNPICGDQFRLFLKVENNTIQEASFQGYGCAISKASTSVLIKKIQRLPFDEIIILLQSFQETITSASLLKDEINPELAAFSAVQQFPERLQCVNLSWEALKKYLQP